MEMKSADDVFLCWLADREHDICTMYIYSTAAGVFVSIFMRMSETLHLQMFALAKMLNVQLPRLLECSTTWSHAVSRNCDRVYEEVRSDPKRGRGYSMMLAFCLLATALTRPETPARRGHEGQDPVRASMAHSQQVLPSTSQDSHSSGSYAAATTCAAVRVSSGMVSSLS